MTASEPPASVPARQERRFHLTAAPREPQPGPERDPGPPADPWRITLTYHHEHLWYSDADASPETWNVSADIWDDSGTYAESHVGDISIVVIDPYETGDPVGLLDGESGDLGLVAETIFIPGRRGLDPDLEEQLEPNGSQILILDSVRLAPPWRGFGLGPLLAGAVIKKLSGGVQAAACYPAPLNDEADSGEYTQVTGEAETEALAAHERGIAALAGVWGKLGFEHFRSGVYVLDLNLTTLDDRLAELREHLGRYAGRED